MPLSPMGASPPPSGPASAGTPSQPVLRWSSAMSTEPKSGRKTRSFAAAAGFTSLRPISFLNRTIPTMDMRAT